MDGESGYEIVRNLADNSLKTFFFAVFDHSGSQGSSKSTITLWSKNTPPEITHDGFRNMHYQSNDNNNNKRFDRRLNKIRKESRQLQSEIKKLKNVGGNRSLKKIGGKRLFLVCYQAVALEINTDKYFFEKEIILIKLSIIH